MRCVTRLTLLLAALPAVAAAQQTGSPLRLTDGWARPQAETSRPTGGYLTIENTGSDTVVITGASCAVASRTEIHEMVTQDGMMRMRRLPELAVPPGATVQLRPGGMHIMLMGLTEPLAAGRVLPCTLTLRGGASVAASLTVRAP